METLGNGMRALYEVCQAPGSCPTAFDFFALLVGTLTACVLVTAVIVWWNGWTLRQATPRLRRRRPTTAAPRG
jgi:hypothetical protein